MKSDGYEDNTSKFSQIRKRRFRFSPLISPCDITLCDEKNESCIIVRNPDKYVKEISTLPLIQTNIMYSNERRQYCQKVLF